MEEESINDDKQTKGRRVSLSVILMVLSILVTVFLYLFLISSNCDSQSLSTFVDSIGAFHTSAGC